MPKTPCHQGSTITPINVPAKAVTHNRKARFRNMAFTDAVISKRGRRSIIVSFFYRV